MWKYILFDLDGTLTESGPGIKNGVRYALRSIGITEENEAVLETFIGPPLVESFAREYGKSEEEGFVLQSVFREYYNVKGVYENEPYPGVVQLLKTLKEKGCVLALASSKPHDMASKVLNHFELAKYFDFVVCGEDKGPLFTKAGVIREALRRAALMEYHAENATDQIEISQADEDNIKKISVMVGDRIYDTEGALANGIPVIGAGWGYAPAGELESSGAVKVCPDVAALQSYLLDNTFL